MLISWPIEPCVVDGMIHVSSISFLVKTEGDGMQLFDPQFTGGIIDLLSDDQDEEVVEKVVTRMLVTVKEEEATDRSRGVPLEPSLPDIVGATLGLYHSYLSLVRFLTQWVRHLGSMNAKRKFFSFREPGRQRSAALYSTCPRAKDRLGF